MDSIEKASEFLMGILERMEIKADIDIHETDENVTLEVHCSDPDRLIGKHGKTIDALQHLITKSVYRDRNQEKGKPIYVDAGGYRAKHVERLQSLATRVAEKVKTTGAPVPMSPMPAYDRRIVHMYIAEMGLGTQSEGEGEDRHIVVLPA